MMPGVTPAQRGMVTSVVLEVNVSDATAVRLRLP